MLTQCHVSLIEFILNLTIGTCTHNTIFHTPLPSALRSVESLPHLLMASSPTRLSAHGSQSPDRRSTGMNSPRHNSSTPPPSGDCPHPSRKNSLTRGALLESLKQPAASAPRQFGRTSSGPSPHSQRVLQVSAAERVRLSLRVSIEYEYKLCTVLYVRNNCVYYMISMSEHFSTYRNRHFAL